MSVIHQFVAIGAHFLKKTTGVEGAIALAGGCKAWREQEEVVHGSGASHVEQAPFLFDVSLLETRDGLLRVIGHDGDNFLGGRDIDWAIVGWAIEQLGAAGVRVERSNPAHAAWSNTLSR